MKKPKPPWIRDMKLRQAVQHNIDMSRVAAYAVPADSEQDKELLSLALAILDTFQEVLDHVVD